MRRNCPLENKNTRPAYNIEEAETVGQVERVVPRIYASLEDRQEDHQSTVVEIVGNIAEQYFSILNYLEQYFSILIDYFLLNPYVGMFSLTA